MVSFLTEAVRNEIEALSPDSPLAKELNEIEDVNIIIAEETAKICEAATLTEITKILLLIKQLKKASAEGKEAIKNDLNSIAEQLATRVEAESGPLRLRETCHGLLLDI
jgi:hypothetical protein